MGSNLSPGNYCLHLAQARALSGIAKSECVPLCPPLQLSGLFQLDDSYETCSSKFVPETGESIQGKKEGGDEDM